jgi:hypothetical protein
MLIMAEGTISPDADCREDAVLEAWLGPMVDEGFIHNGYVRLADRRVWLVLSSPDLGDADRRLSDLPEVRNGSLAFTTTTVTALRFR